MNIISSEQLKLDRFDYPYKTKWAKEAINIDNKELLEKLSKEVDRLACDDTKNEKIGVQFRSIALNDNGDFLLTSKGEVLVDDISMSFERDAADCLLSGKALLEVAEEYKVYVQSLGKNLNPEVTYYYYALNLKNNKEESHDVETNDVISLTCKSLGMEAIPAASKFGSSESLDVVMDRIAKYRHDPSTKIGKNNSPK